jgi:hypothetical protein
MDHVAFPLVVGGFVTAVATAYGLLPERLDVTHVFAAYGAGAIIGDAVAVRHPWTDPARTVRRWGSAVMACVGAFWVIGLLLGIL